MSYLENEDYKQVLEIVEEYNKDPLTRISENNVTFLKWAVRVIYAGIQRDVAYDVEIDYREFLVEDTICRIARMQDFYKTLYDEDGE